MRQAYFAALLAPIMLAATPVAAADLPRRSAPPVDYYAPTPAATWQGFYFGVNGGYGWGAFTDGSDWVFGKPSGGMIGVTAGYNYLLAPNFLVGLEADIDFTGMKDWRAPYFGLTSATSMDDLLTVRGRAGYTLDRALFFVTGGFAGTRNTISVSNWWTGFSSQQSIFQAGWALGGGVEYMFLPNLSGKAEYLFTSVGSDQFFNFSTSALQAGTNSSQVRAGLNYHF
jgi:outer membrane immunogenic protein